MPELLTPPRRNKRAGPVIAPAISVRFLASEIWISREARLVAGAWIRNVGAEVARHIEIPELVVDERVRCRFRTFDDLDPGEEASVDPVFCLDADKGHLEHATLTGVISRSIVRHVLAGRPPKTAWSLRVSYEDDNGRRYALSVEIALVDFPLSLRVTSPVLSDW